MATFYTDRRVDAVTPTERVDVTRARPLYRSSQIVWYVLGLVEVLLGFRFLLRLLQANPAAGFTQFIYDLSAPFVAPFVYVFRATSIDPGNVVEWSTLLAMAVYYLLALLIVRALVMAKPVSNREADERLPEQDKV